MWQPLAGLANERPCHHVSIPTGAREEDLVDVKHYGMLTLEQRMEEVSLRNVAGARAGI